MYLLKGLMFKMQQVLEYYNMQYFVVLLLTVERLLFMWFANYKNLIKLVVSDNRRHLGQIGCKCLQMKKKL